MNSISIEPQQSLEDTRQLFQHWRRRRSNRREAIPGKLWEAAVELCHTHSITKVSRTLGVSYAALKQRLPDNTNTEFMRIDLGCVTGQWNLDCKRPDGSSIHLSGHGHLPDIIGVLKAFLS